MSANLVLRGRRVGLLGGSFNPAHAGHLAISLDALRLLSLNEVWWLVSPQNPLKSPDEMASFETRKAGAEALVAGERIRISDFERRAGTRFTADTIGLLSRRYPDLQFVWLMGADNLVQFHRWQHWRKIAASVPIAVFDRPGCTYPALASRFAQCYRRQRCRLPRALAGTPPPAWSFLFTRRRTISATELRRRRPKKSS